MRKVGYRIYLVLVAIILASVCVICPTKFAGASETKATTVHFIDVGQGDASLVELSNGETILIDGGNTDAGKTVCKYIEKLGITQIDYMIATHSDQDHIGGLIKVLEKFEVKNIYRPFTISTSSKANDELYTLFSDNIDSLSSDDDEVYAKFIKLVYAETCDGNLSNIFVTSTDKIIVSGDSGCPYMIEFLMPQCDTHFTSNRISSGYTVRSADENNDNSAMVLLSTENSSYLFAGDATENEENVFINNLSYSTKKRVENVDVLKVAHHGSKGSSSEKFLNLVKPKNAIISVGAGNDYGHPNAKAIERLTAVGAVIYRTDELGTIIVTETGTNVFISNIKTESFAKKYAWLLYLIIGLVAVGVVVIRIAYPKIKKKKEFGGNKKPKKIQ